MSFQSPGPSPLSVKAETGERNAEERESSAMLAGLGAAMPLSLSSSLPPQTSHPSHDSSNLLDTLSFPPPPPSSFPLSIAGFTGNLLPPTSSLSLSSPSPASLSSYPSLPQPNNLGILGENVSSGSGSFSFDMAMSLYDSAFYEDPQSQTFILPEAQVMTWEDLVEMIDTPVSLLMGEEEREREREREQGTEEGLGCSSPGTESGESTELGEGGQGEMQDGPSPPPPSLNSSGSSLSLPLSSSLSASSVAMQSSTIIPGINRVGLNQLPALPPIVIGLPSSSGERGSTTLSPSTPPIIKKEGSLLLDDPLCREQQANREREKEGETPSVRGSAVSPAGARSDAAWRKQIRQEQKKEAARRMRYRRKKEYEELKSLLNQTEEINFSALQGEIAKLDDRKMQLRNYINGLISIAQTAGKNLPIPPDYSTEPEVVRVQISDAELAALRSLSVSPDLYLDLYNLAVRTILGLDSFMELLKSRKSVFSQKKFFRCTTVPMTVSSEMGFDAAGVRHDIIQFNLQNLTYDYVLASYHAYQDAEVIQGSNIYRVLCQKFDDNLRLQYARYILSNQSKVAGHFVLSASHKYSEEKHVFVHAPVNFPELPLLWPDVWSPTLRGDVLEKTEKGATLTMYQLHRRDFASPSDLEDLLKELRSEGDKYQNIDLVGIIHRVAALYGRKTEVLVDTAKSSLFPNGVGEGGSTDEKVGANTAGQEDSGDLGGLPYTFHVGI